MKQRKRPKLFFIAVAMSGTVALADNASARIPGPSHNASLRRHTGIPSLAVSPKNGRLWVTFYGGITPGEDSNNYVSLVTSSDGGKSWETVLVADPDGPGPRRAFDPELWVSPDGKLRWFWTERVVPLAGTTKDAYAGCLASPTNDALMMATLDAEYAPGKPVAYRRVARGVMMCKPIAMRGGEWLLPVAHWYEEPSACFYASADAGRTFALRGGVSHFPKWNREFDEHTVVELNNGDLLTFIRAGKKPSCLESVSHDGGRTWAVGKKARFEHTSSRHFLRRLKSGNLLLVKHGAIDKNVGRKELMAFISPDDGATWRGGLMIDERENASYPDGDQAADGTIFVTYDRNRVGTQEILLAAFSEDEARAGKISHPKSFLRRIVTKK